MMEISLGAIGQAAVYPVAVAGRESDAHEVCRADHARP